MNASRAFVFGALLALLIAGRAGAKADGVAATLPDDPDAMCSNDVMTEATKSNGCPKALYGRKPTEKCCASLFEYYGPNSTLSSQNCFCVKDYWSFLIDKSNVAIRWTTHLDGCRKLGYGIYYYIKKGGPCDGVDWPVKEETPAPPPVPLPKRSFGRWVRDLRYDTWGAILFTIGIISVIGFAIIAWPFVFSFALDTAGIVRKLYARKDQ